MAALPRARGEVTEARHVAAQICADLRRGELLDSSFDRQTVGLDPRDRRFTRELVYGMLRHRAWIDALLEARVRGGLTRLDDDVLDLLRLGAYQLLSMRSVPPYAAIAQTVELAKRRHGLGPSGLTNAVLRRLDRERDALTVETPSDPIDALALAESHPRWLVARWVSRWGEAETRKLLQANNVEAPLVARPVHAVREQVEAMLEASGITVSDAPLVPDSIVLASPVSALTELGAFRQGLFHLQDPGSTLVTKYAAIPEGATVADVCAAPGGKSVELSRRASAVFASDLSLGRLRRVVDNVQRMELSTVFPYVADASEVVAPGGLLVYSTCSLESEENDAQVERFLSDHPHWRLDPPSEGAVPSSVLDAGRLRVLPQRHGCDGAFAARLRRVS
jgi:16S rRNA (cytosine967-C5)-methyltransferase